jgi:hypothetical protein
VRDAAERRTSSRNRKRSSGAMGRAL